MNAPVAVSDPTDLAVVTIPIHNEADVIHSCLSSLAGQQQAGRFEVVALLNNCTDATAEIVARLAPTLPYPLHVHDLWLDAGHSGAGIARHLAMQYGLRIAGPGGILLTTDADARLPANWIARNRAHLAAGADAVAGMALIDPDDEAALPPRLIEDDARETEFLTLLDEIDWLIDPDAADPWPRHTEHSGASIAVRPEWYARAGGIPPIPLGEDRSFFTALRRIDARIRHAPDVIVTVSGRTVGRAKGGMADTIARRLREPDQWLDDRFEPAADRVRRAALRSALRDAWQNGRTAIASLAAALHVPVAAVRRCLTAETFGGGWSDLESISPVLRPRPVPVARLNQETPAARGIVDRFRTVSAKAHPAGSVHLAPAV